MRTFEYITEESLSVQDLLYRNGYSKRLVIALKQTENGLVVNGKRVRSTTLLSKGDKLVVTMPEAGGRKNKSSLSIPVVYEDDDIIVCDKPAGVVCHRSGGHQSDTLEHVFSDRTFRAVCRLDKDTSGLMVIAKHQLAAAALHGNIDKEYIAVVNGVFGEKEGVIELPIMREAAFEPKQIVDEDGLPSRTLYRVIWEGDGRSAVSCILHTGRMHQIRVHMSAVGHPLFGDVMYGGKTDEIVRHALHCAKIGFIHPITKMKLEFASDLPDDMCALMR
ncbi:MAG: RluA family pseudouridine synthase [Oscillospiraceae bacterium]|nr:RluA family pseudouridine synthase [Oscillospiraceae bacterium]